MLNDIWSNLVNEVKAAKKRYEELEAAMTITNNHPRNPSYPSCLLVCAKEGIKGKRRWGASITREMSDHGNRDFVKSRNLKP